MAKNPATVVESKKVLKTKKLALFQGFEDAYQVLCERLRTHQFTHGLDAKLVANKEDLLLRLKLNKKARALVVPRQLENGETVYVITDLILDHNYGNKISQFDFTRVDRILAQNGLLQPKPADAVGGGTDAAGAGAGAGGGADAPQAQVDVVDASFYGGQLMEFTGGQIACFEQLDRHLDDDAFKGLLTGPAGSGKTCMIAQTAQRLADSDYEFIAVAKSPAVRRLLADEFPEKYKNNCFDYESLLRDIGVLFDNAAGQPTVLNDEQQPLEVVGEDYFREFFKNAKNRNRRVQKARSRNDGGKDILTHLTWEQLHQEFSLMVDEFDDYKSQSVFIADVSQKIQLWDLYQDFKKILAEESKCYLPFHHFSVPAEPYRKKVAIDEGADFTRQELRSVFNLCPWLLVHGDDHQALVDPTQPMLWFSRLISSYANHGIYRLDETLRSSRRAVAAGNRLLQAKKHLGKKVTLASQVIRCGSLSEGKMFSHIGNKSGTEWWYEQVETMVMCHPSRTSEVQSDLSAVQVSSVAGYKGLSCGRAVIVDLLCASAEEANRLAGLFLKTIDGKKSRYQLDEECAELELFINHLYVAIMRSTDEVALMATKNLPDLNRLSQLLTQRDPAVLQEVKQVSVQPKPDTKAASDRTAWEHQLSRLEENDADRAVINAVKAKIKEQSPKPKSTHGGSKEKVGVQPIELPEFKLAKKTFVLKRAVVSKNTNNKKKSKGKKKSKSAKEAPRLVLNLDVLDSAINLSDNEFIKYLKALREIHFHSDFRRLLDEVRGFCSKVSLNKEEKFERKIKAHQFHYLFMMVLYLNHKEFYFSKKASIAVDSKNEGEIARLRERIRLAEDDVSFDIFDGNKLGFVPLMCELLDQPSGVQFMRDLLNENEDAFARVMSVNRMSAKPFVRVPFPVFHDIMMLPECVRLMHDVLDKNADLFFQIVTPDLLCRNWAVGSGKVASVFHMWCAMDSGLDLLLAACKKSPDKFKNFLVDSLLFSLTDVGNGQCSSVFFSLLRSEKACMLLGLIFDLNDKIFYKMLEKDDLYVSISGLAGDNAFYRLCLFENGRYFLLNMANKNKELFLKSVKIPALLLPSVDGKYYSTPLAVLSQKVVGCEILGKIFENDLKSFLDLMSGDGFYRIDKGLSGSTVFYNICSNQEGCQLLLKVATSNPIAFSKLITQVSLLLGYYVEQWIPSIYALLCTAEGCEVLKIVFKNNPELFISMIRNGSFHLCVKTESAESILFQLCRSGPSCKLLFDLYGMFPNEVLSLMTPDVLLNEYHFANGVWSILFSLTVHEFGCKLLEKILEVDQYLFYALISRRAFHKAIKPNTIQFPLASLCYKEFGCHLLVSLFNSLPKSYMRLISAKILMMKINSFIILHSLVVNESGVQLLINCIDHRPALLKKLIRKGAFHVANKTQWPVTPLHYLCLKDIGISLLEKLSISRPNEFVGLMTADALLDPNLTHSNAETILYRLASSERGCKLLGRLLELNPPLFIELIDRGGFSKSIDADPGNTAFQNLTDSDGQIQFLLNLFKVAPKIFVKLVTVDLLLQDSVFHGVGSTALYWLTCFPAGCQLLRVILDNIPQLFESIVSHEGFSFMRKGQGYDQTTPVYCLCTSEEGAAFLLCVFQNDISLFKRIFTVREASLVPEPETMTKSSPFFVLFKSDSGRALLMEIYNADPKFFWDLMKVDMDCDQALYFVNLACLMLSLFRSKIGKVLLKNMYAEKPEFFIQFVERCESDGQGHNVKFLREFLCPVSVSVVKASMFSQPWSPDQQEAPIFDLR